MSRAFTVLLFVCLGALVSVLVAARYAIVYPAGGQDELTGVADASLAALWEQYAIRPRFESASGWRSEIQGLHTLTLTTESDYEAPNFEFYACEIERLGWPVPCFRRDSHFSGTMTAQSVEYRWTLLVGSVRLPTRPQWGGLAICTLVYGGVAFLVVRSFGALRRRARLDRRECPSCAYVLRPEMTRPEATCPECGSSVPTRLLERPRQLLRWWMVPLILAPVSLAALFLAARTLWLWTRFQLRYVEPILRWETLLSLLFGWAWVFFLCECSFHDRRGWSRHALAATISLVLVSVAYVSLYIIALRVLARAFGYA